MKSYKVRIQKVGGQTLEVMVQAKDLFSAKKIAEAQYSASGYKIVGAVEAR